MKYARLVAVAGMVTALACNRAQKESSPAESTRQRTGPPPAQENEWHFYNGSLSGDRYSPLRQITTENVSDLKQVCTFDTGDTVSFQSGLVMANGTLYATAFQNTYAIDPTTCTQKWRHSRSEPPTVLQVNRGVGFAENRVFRGTGDAHVVAIDATNGSTIWDVAIGDAKLGESAPMSPIAWQGLVFAGNAGGDNFGVRGRVYALEAATGRTIWQFNTIPESGPVKATWQKASAKNPPTGGATWTSYALDELTGILYVPTGNPAPDFLEQMHPGDNLYAGSIVALDAKSGRILDFIQLVPHDYHDWDVAAGPALITTKSGKILVAAGAKDGQVYGIDRGGLNQPAGASSPEAPTATRAMKVLYHAVATTRENVDTPLNAKTETRFCPGSQGGIEWNGPGYSRDLGLVFVNAIDWCTSIRVADPATLAGRPGMPWSGSADPKLAFGRMDPFESSQGWLTAVDADTGEVRWKYRSSKPLVAGVTPTAGGLVFTGDLDGNVRAFDAKDGRELWYASTGKAIGGGVVSYEAKGKQYIAVAAGMNAPLWPTKGGPARVVIYALP